MEVIGAGLSLLGAGGLSVLAFRARRVRLGNVVVDPYRYRTWDQVCSAARRNKRRRVVLHAKGGRLS